MQGIYLMAYARLQVQGSNWNTRNWIMYNLSTSTTQQTASWSLNCHALDDDYTNKGAGVSSSDFNIGITSTTETQEIELSFDYVQSEYNSPHIPNSTHFTIWQSLSCPLFEFRGFFIQSKHSDGPHLSGDKLFQIRSVLCAVAALVCRTKKLKYSAPQHEVTSSQPDFCLSLL